MRAKDLTDTGQGEKLVRIEVNGTSADDTIDGNIGRDVLKGHDGNDALRGLRGDDTLVGGIGADHLAGGGGRDVFQFDLAKESDKAAAARDTISDFRAGKDTIHLGGIDANLARNGDQDFHFIGAAAFHGMAGELRYKAVHAGVIVKGDVNGDGAADFSIGVEGTSTLGVSDFVL